jgi:hypothetical protein
VKNIRLYWVVVAYKPVILAIWEVWSEEAGFQAKKVWEIPSQRDREARKLGDACPPRYGGECTYPSKLEIDIFGFLIAFLTLNSVLKAPFIKFFVP